MKEKLDLSALRINRNTGEPVDKIRPGFGWITGFVLAAILGGGILSYIFFISPGSGEKEAEVVSVMQTFDNPSDVLLTASGYVVAQREAAVASKGTGRLEFLGVEEGDKVLKGQVLARLENSDVLAALQKAQADLTVARADSAEAALTLHRQQMLDSLSMTAKANLDAAEAGYLRVIANINLAKASIRQAEVDVENTVIRAPFDGTVLTKNADVGEIVAPFAASSNSRGAVVTIADMSSLEVEADVSESNFTRVQLNQPCQITLDAYPDRRYAGYVQKIVPTADRGKATVLTKVAFRELDRRVLPEMSAKVEFLSEESLGGAEGEQAKLTIPASALLQRDENRYVLLVKDQAIEEREVSTGEAVNGRVEITSGLRQGDQIVLFPNRELKNGSKVKIKQ